jgi:hypothetical protein
MPWAELDPLGYERVEMGEPGERFVRLVRNSVSNGTMLGAEYETATPSEGLSEVVTRFDLRLAPDFGGVCGAASPRVFRLSFGPLGAQPTYTAAVEVSPTEVRAVRLGSNTEVLAQFELETPLSSDWNVVEITAELPDVDTTPPRLHVTIGDVNIPSIPLPEAVETEDVVVAVGPSARPTLAPPMGCFYDLDNIVALPFQP